MRIRHITGVLLLTAFLSGCSDAPEYGAPVQTQDAAPAPSVPEPETGLTIGPQQATVETVIMLKTTNPRISSGEALWYVNGDRDVSATGFRFTPSGIRKGDIVQAVVVDGSQEYRSNELVIQNTPPVIRKASLTPASPLISDIVRVDLQAFDADDDRVTLRYEWNIDGAPAGEEDYLQEGHSRGSTITVMVTPFDGESTGRPVRLTGQIVNSLPVLEEGPRESSFEGSRYTYQVSATDPDGDALTYTLEEGPEGMTIDSSSGLITWEAGPDKAGTYELRVSISDNNGGILIVPITTTISFQEVPAEGESENQKT